MRGQRLTLLRVHHHLTLSDGPSHVTPVTHLVHLLLHVDHLDLCDLFDGLTPVVLVVIYLVRRERLRWYRMGAGWCTKRVMTGDAKKGEGTEQYTRVRWQQLCCHCCDREACKSSQCVAAAACWHCELPVLPVSCCPSATVRHQCTVLLPPHPLCHFKSNSLHLQRPGIRARRHVVATRCRCHAPRVAKPHWPYPQPYNCHTHCLTHGSLKPCHCLSHFCIPPHALTVFHTCDNLDAV